MALSANETYLKAKEASDKITGFINKINSMLNNLDNFSDNLVLINNKIKESIIADDIISCSFDATNDLTKEIENFRGIAEKLIKDAVSNFNSYISYLESDYNSSLKEDEIKIYLQRLDANTGNIVQETKSPVELNNDRNATEIPKEGVTPTSNTKYKDTLTNNISPEDKKTTQEVNKDKYSETVNSNYVNINDNTNNTANNINTNNNNTNNNANINAKQDVYSNSSIYSNTGSHNSQEINNYFDKILKQNIIENIDSRNIQQWDDYVRLLLLDNKLDNLIEKVSISNHVITCLTKNGMKMEFNDINSTNELIKEIRMNLSNNVNNG